MYLIDLVAKPVRRFAARCSIREVFPMKYGYFDDQAREYVITRPDTPLPWINYLGSSGFF